MFTRPIGLLGPRNFAAPVWIGTGSIVSGTSATVVTNARVNDGDTIVLFIPMIGGQGITSASDPSGNNYAYIHDTGVTGIGTNYRVAAVAKALPSGSTITVGTGASDSDILVIAFKIPGVLPFSSVDQSPRTDTSTAATAATAITATTTSPREVALGMVCVNGNVTITPNSGWTTVKATAQATISFLVAFQLLLNTASLSWAPSWGSSLNWGGGLITFRGYN